MLSAVTDFSQDTVEEIVLANNVFKWNAFMAFGGMSLNYTSKAYLPCLSLSVFTFHGCKSLVLHGFAKPCPLVFKVRRNETESRNRRQCENSLLDLDLLIFSNSLQIPIPISGGCSLCCVLVCVCVCVVNWWESCQFDCYLEAERRVEGCMCTCEHESDGCTPPLLHNDEILSVWPGTTLSRPAQIAFYNLMRQIFFNGNPGQGHDSHDKT